MIMRIKYDQFLVPLKLGCRSKCTINYNTHILKSEIQRSKYLNQKRSYGTEEI